MKSVSKSKVDELDTIPFSSLVSLLEKVSKVTKIDRKKTLLRQYAMDWRNIKRKSDVTMKDDRFSFFSILRLLLPQHDQYRLNYGLKETKLGRLIVDALGIQRSGEDGQKLLKYKSSSGSSRSTYTDFGGVAYSILKSRMGEGKKLSINDVNEKLDGIARLNGMKDQNTKMQNEMVDLIRSMSAIEMKWLLRIILKDLRAGIKEKVILVAYHPDAIELFEQTSDLQKVADVLEDESKRLKELSIIINSPCRPMLAERLNSLDEVRDLFHQDNRMELFLQMKLDGERFQLHYSENEIRLFSRNSNDFTSSFESFIKSIKKSFPHTMRNCIIDGELCLWSPTYNRIVSKGEGGVDLKSVCSKSTTTDLHPIFFVFDILLLNDVVLTRRTLKERMIILSDNLEKKHNWLEIMDHSRCKSAVEVIDELNRKVVDCGEEGLMLKKPESEYKPNGRQSCGWYKLKPDYLASINDDLDLVIIGGYRGSGRRKQLVSHFLLAIYDDLNKIYLSFAKVGTGYSLDELKMMNEKLEKFWRKSSPSNVAIGKEKPDFYINPENSMVVEIRAFEIISSKNYFAKYSLRFPRMICVRSDKTAEEVALVGDVAKLMEMSGGKLAVNQIIDGEMDEGISLKHLKKRLKRRQDKSEDDDTQIKNFRSPDTFHNIDERFVQTNDEVKVKENLLDGRPFCVIVSLHDHEQHSSENNSKWNKRIIENRITELGGICVQNAINENTTFIVTNADIVRVKNIISTGKWNVMNINWLKRYFDDNQPLNFRLDDFVFAKLNIYSFMRRQLNEKKKIENSCTYQIMKVLKELEELKKSIEGDSQPIFSRCVIQAVDPWTIDKELDKKIINNGGEIIKRGIYYPNDINKRTTHVIVERKKGPLSMLKEVLRERQSKFYIVKLLWLEECLKKNNYLQPTIFHPNKNH
ncbi:hypothetical protein SNEBB_004140 [Seison nebaliae]|nr:hypothetical protein SNEBB_004140 [Seison nebaliae]